MFASADRGEGRQIHVRVPASSANLGPGFDSLGLALAIYDHVKVEVGPPGSVPITIAASGEGADTLPTDASHLVVVAIKHTLANYGVSLPPLRLTAHNGIPLGRGLGSSGAAIAAGVMAGAGILAGEHRVRPDELLRLATELEGHPDNVAPALFGGLTVAWTDRSGPHSIKLPVHRGVSALVLVPDSELSTAVARSLQPESVPLADASFNVSRTALLVTALTIDPKLLLSATEDRLHQPYRASAMPDTAALVARLRDAGHAAVVSGAGPAILVFADNPADRERAASLALQSGLGSWRAHSSAVDARGAEARWADGREPTRNDPAIG